MPNTQAIGIFDSGIGGLTIAKALQEALPHERFLYFGDTAHLPYGDKSLDTIQGYALAITQFLLSQQVKAIVIACNTASAAAYEQVVLAAGHVPVFEVITPAVHTALAATHTQRIAVIGTKTTIGSHVYVRHIHAQRPDAFVLEKATPLLAPMIEEGWANNTLTQGVIDAYMSDTGFQHIDTLILGCTHYPLIKEPIARYFTENLQHNIAVIDSSVALALRVREALTELDLLAPAHGKPLHQFFVSDLTDSFANTAALFFGKKLPLERLSLEPH